MQTWAMLTQEETWEEGKWVSNRMRDDEREGEGWTEDEEEQ